MRCKSILVAVLVILTSLVTAAEEGMWRPEQLPQLGAGLRALGLEIEPARLADLTADPMGAVISLGGCTASFVSPEGLVITNHHCALGSIQYNSTAERNLLTDGFLAATRADELPAAPGSRVYVTVAADDVTATVARALAPATTGAARTAALEQVEKQLVAACEENPDFRCRVASFHGGLQFTLYRQLEIRDVRLVYAPAEAIGNYGDDVDNWMWPRHTGDYSFYRAYVGRDGRPAAFAPDNVPFTPRHWLRVATDGVAAGDFVMVAGYPGRTSRYRLGHEVESVATWWYPAWREAYEEAMAVIRRETADRPAAAIAYASAMAGFANATKNYAGMLAGFAHSDLVAHKQALEAELQTWVEADSGRQERWGASLADLDAVVEEGHRTQARDLEWSMIGRTQMLDAARTLYRLSREREKPDAEREPGYQERDLPRIQDKLDRLQRRFDPTVDRALLRHFLARYARLPVEQRFPVVDRLFGITLAGLDEAACDRVLGRLYQGSALADRATRLGWLEADHTAIEASDDEFLKLAVALYDTDMTLEAAAKEHDGRLLATRPQVMAALLAYRESRGEPVYPDANGTLRVSFGTVAGYSPRDGVSYQPFTTAAGILEKATGVAPFSPPPALAAAVAAADWGPYAGAGAGLPVDFLATLDSTGGNSGSPTLDRHGRLVGLLFDGNWESIASNWDFLPQVTRSIHVDIRYVLWVMDRVDRAWHLVREMGVEPSFAGPLAAAGAEVPPTTAAVDRPLHPTGVNR